MPKDYHCQGCEEWLRDATAQLCDACGRRTAPMHWRFLYCKAPTARVNSIRCDGCLHAHRKVCRSCRWWTFFYKKRRWPPT